MVGPIVIHTHGPLEGATVAFSKGGVRYVTAVLKATFAMIHEGVAAIVPAAPIVEVDTPFPGLETLEHASELAPFLPRVDVLLRGHARARAGELAPAISARLAVYRDRVILDKTLHVYGEREDASAYPRDFAALPLVYEIAEGGPGTSNPVGVGAPGVANVVLPKGRSGTPGFAAIPVGWPSRLAALRKGLVDGVLELDDDFPFGSFQAAPRDQCVDVIHGDEWILVDGMHGDLARFATKLPGPVVVARLLHEAGKPSSFDLCCDTVTIDVDARTVSLVWRGHLPMPRVELAKLEVDARIDLPDVDGEQARTPPRSASVAPKRPEVVAEETPAVDEDTPDASEAIHAPLGAPASPAHASGPRTDPPPAPAERAFKDMPFARAPIAPTFGRAPSENPPPVPAARAEQVLPFRAPGQAPFAPPRVESSRPAEPSRLVVEEPSTSSWQDDPTPNEGFDVPTAAAGPLPFQPAKSASAVLKAESAPVPAESSARDTLPPPADLVPPLASAPEPVAPPMPEAPKVAEPQVTRATPALPVIPASSPPVSKRSPEAVESKMPMQIGNMSLGASTKPIEPGRTGAVAAPLDPSGHERDPERAPGPVDEATIMPTGEVEAVGSQSITSKLVVPPSPSPQVPAGEPRPETVAEKSARVATPSRPPGVAEAKPAEGTPAQAKPAELKPADGKAAEAKAAPEPVETGVRGVVVAKLKRREAFYDANYAGADLSGIDFSEAALSGINLAGAKLSGCNFKGARMSGAKLTGADLREATLVSADLAQADLSRATLERAIFDSATLTDANFTLAVGQGASFDAANAVRATFAQGQWEDATFRGATLTSTDFSGAELSRAVFERAQLASARFSDARGADAKFEHGELDQATFTGATLKGASFDGSSLQGSTWERATLDACSFRGAKMERAVVARATIGRACFADADLEGANFIGATGDATDFTGAKLVSADLRQTKLGDATFERADLTKVNAHKAVFAAPRFVDANLTGASFRAAKMRNATLAGADLHETDLRDADLENAKLKGAKNRATAKLGGASLRGAEEDEPEG